MDSDADARLLRESIHRMRAGRQMSTTGEK
ncbi:hypothetical protein X772_13540 [Mesorhizobium sp. LSJC280B00]|nr:hypothetical protein X772_13540 [Mesorhizobium sp. LSJC280B00]